MFTRLLFTLFLTAALWPRLSAASSCVTGEITDEAFSSAKYVFVFRVLGTEIHEDGKPPLGTEPGFGRLRIVENLRGRAPYETFSFSAHRGCGSKLVPGHYYVGVSSSPKGVFVAGPSTVLDLGSEYREGIDNARCLPHILQTSLRRHGQRSAVFGSAIQGSLANRVLSGAASTTRGSLGTCLTIHSSRSSFAARLNSGVRRHWQDDKDRTEALTTLTVSSALALPFALVMAYDAHRISEARLAYEQCSSLNLPLKLADFSSRFGPAVHMLAEQDGVTHSFEPNSGYQTFASGTIQVTTASGSDTVTKFYCDD